VPEQFCKLHFLEASVPAEYHHRFHQFTTTQKTGNPQGKCTRSTEIADYSLKWIVAAKCAIRISGPCGV
jgi:hypothetical protein